LALQRLWLCGNAPFKRALKRRDVRVKGTAAFDGAAEWVPAHALFFCRRPFLEAGALPGLYVPRPLCAQSADGVSDVATDDTIVEGVAGRYASALFDLAKEGSKVADLEQALGAFQSLLDQSPDLSRLVRSPVISANDQGRAIGAVLERAGIGGLAANFLKLVTNNRRLFVVQDIIKAYRALAAKARGEVTAEVTSAVPLNDEQVKVLKDTLKASVGKDVTLQSRVDPSLLGGLIVKVGSRMIDSSLKTKLQNMKVALSEANA
jgi:F-type H+-transporting ATPase subunit delta